jgi:hypothetical protein
MNCFCFSTRSISPEIRQIRAALSARHGKLTLNGIARESMYVISAHVAGFGCDKSIVCCFDPSVVVVRLREAFPEVEVMAEDIAWRDCGLMKQSG